ncbi:Retrotransposon-derived protein PEG10 [Colletotrichum orbiculare MAFF 240422]|uniref:Retrotransposon-derived protein PEG10 n=1 Tax=Colletotrichum orbiculare (strain 104-T / ATCC 96160 / CBS 514.97 / LARS 414 / MAFF 240422) TaxID=1213857 RepID=A0A484FX16_COLOR|nr:Retrotransposon-derived protein PEG10 [Colletotrichum orbiculare MAFF 240422]
MSAKHQTPSTSSGSQGTPPKGKQPVKPLDQEMKDVEPSSDEEDDTAELQNLHDNPDQQRLLALQQEVNTLRTAANIIQTPVESREKLRLNSPQAFDGTPGYLKGFLTQVRAYHRFHNLSFKDEAEQVIHAASFLKGRALAWFEPHLTDFLTHDWNDLKLETQTIFAGYHGFESALISLFQEPDEQRQYERDLAALKQKGAATHYAAEFRRICARLDYTDDTKIFMFYQGLKEDVKDELVKQDRPSDFITYAELAIKIDNRLFERRREKDDDTIVDSGSSISQRPGSEEGKQLRIKKIHPTQDEQFVMFYGVPGNRTLNYPKTILCDADNELLRINHPAHQTIFWACCVQDDCMPHLGNKFDRQFFPRRFEYDPIPNVYLDTDLPFWELRRFNEDHFATFAPSEDYPMACANNIINEWTDCESDHCMIHYVNKAREWRYRRNELRKQGKDAEDRPAPPTLKYRESTLSKALREGRIATYHHEDGTTSERRHRKQSKN